MINRQKRVGDLVFNKNREEEDNPREAEDKSLYVEVRNGFKEFEDTIFM